MTPEMLWYLQIYHFWISAFAAACAVMVMQIVGREWTTSWRNSTLQHLQRFGLGALAIALFCSAVRLPYVAQCGPVTLLSAAAVNTAIFIIMIPTALMGREHTSGR